MERAFWEIRVVQASNVEPSLFPVSALLSALEITALNFWLFFVSHQIQLRFRLSHCH